MNQFSTFHIRLQWFGLVWWSILFNGSYRFGIPTWVQCQAQLIYGDYRSEYTSLFAPRKEEQNTNNKFKNIEIRQAFSLLIQLFLDFLLNDIWSNKFIKRRQLAV